VKVRALLLVSVVGLPACAADYIDLGYDHTVIGTGGTAGSGGTGGGQLCTPGETRACYTGPDGTKGQGICKSGKETCNPGGSAFGPCDGEVTPKPAEDCAPLEDDNCDGAVPPCSGDVLWAQRFGDSTLQFARDVAVDGAGNVVMTGSFAGSINFGGATLTAATPNSYADVFAAKFDTSGAHLWSKNYGKSLSQRARRVTTNTAGDIIFTGDFDGAIDFGDGEHASMGVADIFLAKLDPNGVTLWSKAFGGPQNQAAHALATDAQGNIVLAGPFSGSVDFGDGEHVSAGGSDIFVAKLDPSGATLWSKAFGGPQDQAAYALATDAEGNIVLAGPFGGSVDFGDGEHASTGGSDVFLTKLDPSGATLWSKAFGGPQDQAAYALATDAQGNIVLAGPFSGSIDFGDGEHASTGGSDVFLAKLDSSGTTLWSKAFGDAKDGQTAYGLAFDPFGNIIVAGAFDGMIDFGNGSLTGAGGSDIFVAKLDPGGKAVWSKRFGDKGAQTATSVATDPAGAVMMTGSLSGTVDVGSTTLTSLGFEDVLLFKLAP